MPLATGPATPIKAPPFARKLKSLSVGGAALSPPTLGACELRVASARSEADSLRSALLEANSRALEASERAAEDILVKKTAQAARPSVAR